MGMKYNEIIGKVRAVYPNGYTDEEMLGWILEVNSDIRRNVEKNQVIHKKLTGTENAIIPPPYDTMYMYYILAQIAYHQKDFDSYKKHIEKYYSGKNGYMAYYIRTNGSERTVFKGWI